MGYLKELHGMTLLGRTPEGTCPECAVKHDPEQPHNRDTYITFDRAADGGWRYAGLCYAGEAKNRVAYKSSLDSLIEAARAALVAQGGYCGGNVKEKAHD